MALKDEQLMAIQHIYMARTCLYGYRWVQQVHMYEFLLFVFVPCIRFGKAEAAYVLPSQTCKTVLHGVAVHCNLIIFLCVIVCEFSLCISMNYSEDSMELLVHS